MVKYLIIIASVLVAATQGGMRAQPVGNSNLSNYTHLNVQLDVEIEIGSTILATPVSFISVKNYLSTAFANTGIPISYVDSNSGSPYLRISIFEVVRVDTPDSYAISYSVEFTMYETVYGRRFISYDNSHDYLVVNRGNDGRANGIWECIEYCTKELTSDWISTH